MTENPKEVAAHIRDEMRALDVGNTPNMRAVRRKYSKQLNPASADFVLAVADELYHHQRVQWLAYELIANHRGAFVCMDEVQLEKYGQGMDSWDRVDTFARTLSGPAWLHGQVDDEVIHRWAESDDLWWRRAALVSTVALNMRSYGGDGDTPRTLAVCRMLVDDHEDMVVKALSWALRALVVHDPDAVKDFLVEYDSVLAARVKREVRNKLRTGLKNPNRKEK